MNKNIYFTLSLTCLILLGACNSPGPKIENISTVSKVNTSGQLNLFYPLNTGRTWSYQLEQYQNETPVTKFKEMTISVVKKTKNEDQETALIKRFYPNSTIHPNQTLATIYADHIDLSRYIQQGIFSAYNPASQDRGKDFITILKLPFETGQSWEGRIFQGGTEKLEILGMETVTVPAGVFSALKVQHHLSYENGKSDDLYYWYASGVGTVKMHEELTFNLSGKWVKLKSIGVLKEYTEN